MVSLDPELSKLFIVLMSTSATFGSQNGSTFSNFRKRKLETSFLQHESEIKDSLQFFPDHFPLTIISTVVLTDELAKVEVVKISERALISLSLKRQVSGKAFLSIIARHLSFSFAKSPEMRIQLNLFPADPSPSIVSNVLRV